MHTLEVPRIMTTIDMQTKRCIKCKADKELSEFYRNAAASDKLSPVCKLCDNARRRQWAEAHREHERAKKKRWRSKHLAQYNNIQRRWRASSPEKSRAHRQVFREQMKKPLYCAIPGCRQHPLYAHHSDYNKPLDVVYFCAVHHKAWHKLFIAEN